MGSVDLNKLIKEPRYDVAVLNSVKIDNHLRVARFYLMALGIGAISVAAFFVFIWSSDPMSREWAKNTVTIIVSSAFGYGVGSHRPRAAHDEVPS